MLRLSRQAVMPLRRQLLQRPLVVQSRAFAERKETMLSSDPDYKSANPGAPVSTKLEIPRIPTTAPAPSTPIMPGAAATIPDENVPRGPPPPPAQPQSVMTPPQPPPPAAASVASTVPKKSRKLRILLYLIVASALGYSGAVLFALNNDNFHDFFTEYVPFGEEIILYFEEKSFQKRFPHARQNTYRSTRAPRDDDKKVNIPFKSGLSWKVSEEDSKVGTDLTAKGKHMSALDANKPRPVEVKETAQQPQSGTPEEKVSAVDAAKKEAKSKPTPEVVKEPSKAESASPPAPQPKTAAGTTSGDSRPPAIAPVSQISALSVPNADEPVVQDLVKIVNDLITVVNADAAANKYSGPMQKAKDSLTSVATKITALRDAERSAAEERIKEAHKEFDEGAKQLLKRIETAQKEDDIKYREEFEAERAKIAGQYESRLKNEVERTQQVMEQRLKNELSEQGIKLKQKFIQDIKSLVESEREGRLSKLSDLSSNVDNLTELTSNWNGVIDANLATQKLQVAVDAVRSALSESSTEHKPRPFVREMAALKLTANSDPIVDAAIASVNPSAYQRGIPSPAQLIDRFRRVAAEVRKASLLPQDAGVASHAASLVLSKVMFKKQGIPNGSDVESILTRTETLLEEGDLDNAAREMNSLQGWASTLSRDWMSDVRKVLEVKQALEVIETEARLQCLRVN